MLLVPLPTNIGNKIKGIGDIPSPLARALVQLCIHYIEGHPLPFGALDKIIAKYDNVSHIEELFSVFSTIILWFTKQFQNKIRITAFKEYMNEQGLPKNCTEELATVLYEPKKEPLINNPAVKCIPTAEFQWRADISVTNKKNQIIPSIIFHATLSNGENRAFHINIQKFHELRFKIASLLKEMKKLESSINT